MKNAFMRVVKPCGSLKNRRFRGIYHLHHQVERNQRVDSFHPDDGSDSFLRIVGSYKSHIS
jgi:hypothetical protein